MTDYSRRYLIHKSLLQQQAGQGALQMVTAHICERPLYMVPCNRGNTTGPQQPLWCCRTPSTGLGHQESLPNPRRCGPIPDPTVQSKEDKGRHAPYVLIEHSGNRTLTHRGAPIRWGPPGVLEIQVYLAPESVPWWCGQDMNYTVGRIWRLLNTPDNLGVQAWPGFHTRVFANSF